MAGAGTHLSMAGTVDLHLKTGPQSDRINQQQSGYSVTQSGPSEHYFDSLQQQTGSVLTLCLADLSPRLVPPIKFSSHRMECLIYGVLNID